MEISLSALLGLPAIGFKSTTTKVSPVCQWFGDASGPERVSLCPAVAADDFALTARLKSLQIVQNKKISLGAHGVRPGIS